MLLNLVFLVQVAASAVVAFLAFFYLDGFTFYATGSHVPPLVPGELVEAYARFAASGAVLIAIVGVVALTTSRTSVRLRALMSLLIIAALLALVAHFMISFQPMAAATFYFNVLIAGAYLLITIFRWKDI